MKATKILASSLMAASAVAAAPAVLPTTAVVGAPTVASAATSYTTYTVKRGDTLYRIGKTYGVSVATIQSLNGMGSRTTIYPGQVLKVRAITTPAPKPTPKPAPKPAPKPVAINAPGTAVNQFQSRQVMVADHGVGTRGTWVRYQWNGTRWVNVTSAASTAIFGKNGVVNGATRHQGSDQTPLGTYSIKYAFGVGNPGTKMTYRKVDGCSNWVGIKAADYNRWREDCAGNHRIGEHLADNTGSLYRQAAVIGYNYDKPVYGRGTGIFLHYAVSYTEGCVALNNRAELESTIRWMNPASNPIIVIKP